MQHTAAFIVVAVSNATAKPVAWLIIGAIFGVILFVRGFLMLRYKQLILNTPFSKIRSASMGLVEISGAADGPRTIPAGITGEACYFYRAMAYQLRQSGRNKTWQCVVDECISVPFFIEDSTGRLLIDPQGASLDIERNFKDEFDTSFLSSNPDMLPENAARFLGRNGIVFSTDTRLEELCIKPGSPLFVFGPLTPNTTPADWIPTVQTPSAYSPRHASLNFFGGAATPIFGSLGAAPRKTVNPLYLASLVVGLRDAGNAPGVSQNPAAEAPKPAAAAWSSISMDDENAPSGSPSAGRSAIATDAAEPSAAANAQDDAGFNLCPPAVIRKGTGGEPYMISTHSQREIVRSLAWKSALGIWGGPALTLTCLYFLALILGWT